jgi:mono/diheme cytochrome c family protein
MFKRSFGAVIAIGAGIFLSAEVQAISLGEFEYRNSCAQCHGASGKGDGTVAPFLTKTPTDLTMLQKNNGGIFPVMNTYSIIEGSADVRVHGPRDMPLWGTRFRARIKDDEDESFSPRDTDEFATTRILALIEYLSTMQVK